MDEFFILIFDFWFEFNCNFILNSVSANPCSRIVSSWLSNENEICTFEEIVVVYSLIEWDIKSANYSIKMYMKWDYHPLNLATINICTDLLQQRLRAYLFCILHNLSNTNEIHIFFIIITIVIYWSCNRTKNILASFTYTIERYLFSTFISPILRKKDALKNWIKSVEWINCSAR